MTSYGQFVYVLTDGLFVKVGRSADVIRRIKNIQCGCPRVIKPVVAFGKIGSREAAAFETEMHRSMKKSRASGEWFDCPLESVLAAAFLRSPWFCGIGGMYTVFCNEYTATVKEAADRENACRDNRHLRHEQAKKDVDDLLACFKQNEVLA